MGIEMERAAIPLAALVGATCGALAEFFFLDRRNAARRRHLIRDRTRAAMRRRAHASVRRAKYLEGVAEGIAHRASQVAPGRRARRERPDDITLAQRVESTAFRRAHVPKDSVSVNAENGVVFLRGQLERPEDIEALARAVAAVEGVREVRNLLHTPTAA
jgi:osmotically-inducible protein OsmY